MNLIDEISSTTAIAGEKHLEYSQMVRRVVKLSEETGELAQAFLDVTSATPRRGKTAQDVIEEAVDVSIVALDIALTCGSKEQIELMFRKKLDRWAGRMRNEQKI